MQSQKLLSLFSCKVISAFVIALFALGAGNLFSQTESVVYHFRSGSDGSNPRSNNARG